MLAFCEKLNLRNIFFLCVSDRCLSILGMSIWCYHGEILFSFSSIRMFHLLYCLLFLLFHFYFVINILFFKLKYNKMTFLFLPSTPFHVFLLVLKIMASFSFYMYVCIYIFINIWVLSSLFNVTACMFSGLTTWNLINNWGLFLEMSISAILCIP